MQRLDPLTTGDGPTVHTLAGPAQHPCLRFPGTIKPRTFHFLAQSTGLRWHMDVSQARTLHILAQPRRLREDMESRRVRIVAIRHARHDAGRHKVGDQSLAYIARFCELETRFSKKLRLDIPE